MPTVRPAPIIGAVLQAVLLAILAATIGLSAVGWLVGAGFGLLTLVALTVGMPVPFGPADWVTLFRATLVGCVTALTADALPRTDSTTSATGTLVGITTVALLLDALDGQVARRTGTVSGPGARFDMEVDAFLILVLSVYLARSMGAWILAIGAMRYAFVAAGWLLPWMRGQLPPRFWRKVVAATQGIVLVVAVAEVLPRPVNLAGVAVALILLIESFGRDVLWLWHRRPRKS